MAIRVLIAEHDNKLRDELRDLVGEVSGCEIVGLATDGQEAVHLAMQLRPEIAFISYELPGLSGAQTCEMLCALAPEIMSVLVTNTKTQERIESALRCGARALLSTPFEAGVFRSLATELAEISGRRRSSELQEWKDLSRFPRVISVTGAKGGVGKSTVAANLAVTLAKRLPEKVALVDLHTQFGDICAMFNINPKATISEMANEYQYLDSDLVEGYTTKHPCGVHILVAAVKPAPLESVSVECLDSLLVVLKRQYRYIVLDMPAYLNSITLHALSHSNTILLVAGLSDVTVAVDTRKLYQAFQEEHIAREKVHLVINQVSRGGSLSVGDLEQVVGCRALVTIPSDGRVIHAVNDGVPLAMTDGSSPVGRSLSRLADLVTGTRSAPEPDGFFGRMGFGRR